MEDRSVRKVAEIPLKNLPRLKPPEEIGARHQSRDGLIFKERIGVGKKYQLGKYNALLV